MKQKKVFNMPTKKNGPLPLADFLVYTVKLKPIIKAQIPGKLITSGISDVATASVHSEKTWAKKWIIGERAKRARHSQVCSIENRGYIYYIIIICDRLCENQQFH